MSRFGEYIRNKRERLQNDSQSPGSYSLRKVAGRAGIEPSYLSKIERGQQPPPGEKTITLLAAAIDEDSDVLLALAGKVSDELQEIIRKRPQVFARLIRELKDMPDHAVLRLVREVKDGNW